MPCLAGCLGYHLESEWFQAEINLGVHERAGVNCEEFHFLKPPLGEDAWPHSGPSLMNSSTVLARPTWLVLTRYHGAHEFLQTGKLWGVFLSFMLNVGPRVQD